MAEWGFETRTQEERPSMRERVISCGAKSLKNVSVMDRITERPEAGAVSCGHVESWWESKDRRQDDATEVICGVLGVIGGILNLLVVGLVYICTSV